MARIIEDLRASLHPVLSRNSGRSHLKTTQMPISFRLELLFYNGRCSHRARQPEPLVVSTEAARPTFDAFADRSSSSADGRCTLPAARETTIAIGRVFGRPPLTRRSRLRNRVVYGTVERKASGAVFDSAPRLGKGTLRRMFPEIDVRCRARNGYERMTPPRAVPWWGQLTSAPRPGHRPSCRARRAKLLPPGGSLGNRCSHVVFWSSARYADICRATGFLASLLVFPASRRFETRQS